eukprot:tig00020537_g10255.t1
MQCFVAAPPACGHAGQPRGSLAESWRCALLPRVPQPPPINRGPDLPRRPWAVQHSNRSYNRYAPPSAVLQLPRRAIRWRAGSARLSISGQGCGFCETPEISLRLLPIRCASPREDPVADERENDASCHEDDVYHTYLSTGSDEDKRRKLRSLRIIETAFMSSFTCLLYVISKLSSQLAPVHSFLSYGYPLPIISVFMRHGGRQGALATISTCLLIMMYLGPTSSAGFMFNAGFLALGLGSLWTKQVPWATSVPLGALIYAGGLFGQVSLVSVLLGCNMWAYLCAQMGSVLAKLSGAVLRGGGLGVQAARVISRLMLLSLITVTSFSYVSGLHLIGFVCSRAIGRPMAPPPEWLLPRSSRQRGRR